MYSPEELKRRQEIQSSLKSIVDTSDSWLRRIRTREFRVRLITSFITLVLSFFILIATVLGSLVAQHGLTYFSFLLENGPEGLFGFVFLAIVTSITCGLFAYFALRKNDIDRLKEMTSLVDQMKKKIVEEDQQEKGLTSTAGEGITENALFLADKILSLLPGLVRRRNQDSILYGFGAFILALIIGRNPPVAPLIAVIVWIYFRWKTRKSYDQELAKIAEQKRILEQRKQEFLETL
jgi:hypothetical protein